MAPTKATKKTATATSVTALLQPSTDEGTRLLEASKKWRLELRAAEKSEDPLGDISVTVTGALDELVVSQVGTMDKIRTIGQSCKRAVSGAEIANDIGKEALLEAKAARKEVTDHAELQRKRIEDLEARAKAALTRLQRMELAQNDCTVIARGIRSNVRGDNDIDAQEALKHDVQTTLRDLNVGGIQVEHVMRMQRVAGDRGRGPPALKITLRSVADKLRIYEGMRRAARGGRNLDIEFQNAVPRYALSQHKTLHKVALEIRRIDKDIKTRVSMGKGDHWPVLSIKRKGEAAYKPAPKGLIDTAKTNLFKQIKKTNAAKKAQKEHRLLYGQEEEPMDGVHEPTAGGSNNANGNLNT